MGVATASRMHCWYAADPSGSCDGASAITRKATTITTTAAAVLMAASLLLGPGCATLGMVGTAAPMVGQEQATHIVWVEVYGRTDRPPKIRWVTGSGLNCTEGSGITGFKTIIGCKAGLTMSPLECSVAFHDGDAFSVTALAHELQHVDQARRGILDPNHKRNEWRGAVWGDPAECPITDNRCGLVVRANAALQEAGL